MRKSKITCITILLLLILMFANLVQAQELTIYNIPSPVALNWKSPKKIFFSFFISQFTKSPYGKQKHPVGHAVVELKDSSRFSLIGITAISELNMVDKVFRQGYGMGVMFTMFKGKLEEADINAGDIQERCKNGDLAFIRYQVSQELFDRLWQYREQYQQNGFDKLYNGLNRPREGLGASCSTFAMSFLELGGLDSILPNNEWKINVLIPDKLIGGPPGGNKRIQFFKIFFSNRWANEKKENYRKWELYDPSKIYTWINRQYANKASWKNIQYTTIGKANGLVIDCRHMPSPTQEI